MPKCQFAGQTATLTGACAVASGPYTGTQVVLVDLSSGLDAQLDTLTCPDFGAQVTLTPTAVLSGQCKYTGAAVTVASTCPAQASASFTCQALSCPVAGEQMPLSGMCTTSLAGAQVAYKVNGVQTLAATCPPPGAPLTVVPYVPAWDGLSECTYSALPAQAAKVESACPAPDQSAVSCAVPKCRFAGDVMQLDGMCTSSQGSITYYAQTGRMISEVRQEGVPFALCSL